MSLQPVLDSIPFVAKVGIRCDAFAPGKIALSLPDHKGNHNHASGLHAGALFTLAETAGSAAAATHPDLASYQLMAKGFTVKYRNAPVGGVVARCHVTSEMARTVLWGVTTTGKADLEIPVEIYDSREELVAEFSAHYSFLRQKRG